MMGWLEFVRDVFSSLLNAGKWRTFDRPQPLKLPDPPPPDPLPSAVSPTLRDESLQLEVNIYGNYPVQGDGKLLGYPLYFRARWDAWEFTVSLNPEVIVDCLLGCEDVPGFFRDGENEGFYLTGRYPQAGDMPLGTAKEILRECARRFTDALSQSRIQGCAED